MIDGFVDSEDRRIVIDDFDVNRLGVKKGEAVFFLSHAHSDHLRGLNETWDFGTIVCTKTTRNYVQGKLRGKTRANFYTDFEMFEPTMFLQLDGLSLTFTALPACHMSGAVMFKFEYENRSGKRRNIFYTGDFRFASKMQSWRRLFDECDFDLLIIDDTFIAPRWQYIPTIEESIHYVLQLVEKQFESKPNSMVFFVFVFVCLCC